MAFSITDDPQSELPHNPVTVAVTYLRPQITGDDAGEALNLDPINPSATIRAASDQSNELVALRAFSSSWHSMKLRREMPNQLAGPNQCVPAALSNGQAFLNSVKVLGRLGAQNSVGTMAKIVHAKAGGTPSDWPSLKEAYNTFHVPLYLSEERASYSSSIDFVAEDL